MSLWNQFAPELMTDLYELTMAESYLKESMAEEATFSLFIRKYPPHRAYFVAAGLEHLLELIPNLRFSDRSLQYLASTGKFSQALLDYLEGFHFNGTIRAIPEGSIFFAHEPILEISGPLIEAQILETLIINVIQLETLIASKAARCVHAARGKSVVDFSFRRTHGVEAGVKVARASYLAGFDGTSNVLAGQIYSIPVFGTMAHSYITSFRNERESFQAFAAAFPDATVLLIDTYDTVCGARKALDVARQLAAQGRQLLGVRLDSGDLVELSRQVRRVFRDGGFPGIKILVSGSLDEFRIQELLDSGANIDTFAVGTRMGVSADAPYFDIAYKLVEYGGRPILKLSSGKKTWIGKKQVYRFFDQEGKMRADLITLLADDVVGGEPLLNVVMEGGCPCREPESLDSIRKRFAREWERLPAPYREIRPLGVYPVRISPVLQDLEEQTASNKRREEVEEECGVR
jgi:nicotinate phosphoribosyltransferase